MYTDLRTCLGHAVTRFDRTRRTPQNPYALGHYLKACDGAMEFMADGASLDDALSKVFTKGPLLDYVKKFVAQKYSGPTCQWFALCDEPMAGHVPHPILGKVPTCKRCSVKHGLIFE